MKSVAFWITPFSPLAAGGEDESIFEAVQAAIRAAATSAGVELQRADDIFASGVIVEQIKGAIERADLVIAVCTGKNPNVFYELGLAEVAHHSAILVASSTDDLPFDVKHWRAHLYGTPLSTDDLSERVRRAIEETLAARQEGASLVVPAKPVAVPEPPEGAPLKAIKANDFITFNEALKALVAGLSEAHIDMARTNEQVQPTLDVFTETADLRYGIVADAIEWLRPAIEYRPNWLNSFTRLVVPWFGRRPTQSDLGTPFGFTSTRAGCA